MDTYVTCRHCALECAYWRFTYLLGYSSGFLNFNQVIGVGSRSMANEVGQLVTLCSGMRLWDVCLVRDFGGLDIS